MKTLRIGLLLLLGAFIMNNTSAQYHQDVLKGMTGQDLFEEVINTYKTSFTMPYNIARDTLYSKIDNVGNNLSCIYTGYSITLNPNVDPTEDAFDKGINAEHSYPQSKGAEEEPARSDLHHLYPTRINVNADRGSLPYGESPDIDTDNWYLNESILSSVPSTNIDLYSELNNSMGVFEPRESMKGNIARGLMYFYTMYRNEANQADPSFFNRQVQTLCEWHFLDPVDQVEWERTWKISAYQEDKPNPFVLDCSLASRVYCNTISDACKLLTPTREIEESYPLNFENITSNDFIHINNWPEGATYSLFDINGRQYTRSSKPLHGTMQLDIPHSGLFFLKVRLESGQLHTYKIIKL